MLLPSAFPCEGPDHAPTSRPTRPSLPSFAIYTPQSKEPSQSPEPTLASSCRALHAILGNPLRSPRPQTIKATKPAPPQLRNPFNTTLKVTKPHNNSQPTALPRGIKKRNRNEFEADLRNTHYGTSTSDSPPDTDVMSTPKRRRRIPLDMPLGLSAADFESLDPEPEVAQAREDQDGDLHMPELSHDCLSDSDLDVDEVDSGYGTSNGASPSLELGLNEATTPDGQDPLWTLDDDRILVEAVLEKLQLSKRAWNDCARRLGKDRDSIGRRWRLLVDKGEVGLKIRRGGVVRRALMEVPGW